VLTASFGSVVLLGHYHYSIDVLAALFITHGVFQTSCWLIMTRQSHPVEGARHRRD